MQHNEDLEARAVRVALEGSRLARTRVGAGALFRLLRDPEDTRQVFVLYVALNAGAFPGILARFMREPDGPRLFAARARLDSSAVDYDALRALPPDTLGGAYARHLDDRGLDPDLFQAPPGVPPEVAYLAQRLRQSHDIWHVVTGYDTDVAGELCLQAFTYGQIPAPGPGVLAAAGTLRWALQMPGLPRRVLRAMRRGQRARPLMAIPWEDHWERPLSELRHTLRL